MSNLSDSDLRELQKQWYKKLKDSGFNDIEDTSSPKRFLKTCHSSYFQLRYHPITFELKQEYFRRATCFYHDHEFENETEREIWRLHADGFSLRESVKELRTIGVKLGKDRIHKIIVRLSNLMKTKPYDSD